MQFQWYPGHMTKAKRAMQEDIKPVSYTHLDVYKRQCIYGLCNPGRSWTERSTPGIY